MTWLQLHFVLHLPPQTWRISFACLAPHQRQISSLAAKLPLGYSLLTVSRWCIHPISQKEQGQGEGTQHGKPIGIGSLVEVDRAEHRQNSGPDMVRAELSSVPGGGKGTWKASRFLRCWRRSLSRARSRSSSSSLSKARMCSSKQISASSLSMSDHREEAQQVLHQWDTLSVPHSPTASRMLPL